MNRSQEREQAFLLVFEYGFNTDMSLSELSEMAVESEFLEPSEFTQKLASLTVTHIDEIDAKIKEFAVGWTLARMTKVALSILRIAVCEILFMDDVPVGVSINEAVELAKTYAAEEDAKFINGVLGSIARSVKQ